MATDKSFEQFFNEGMESLTKTAFPTLSKFMDFKSQDAKNDNTKASDSASETEQTLTPNGRRNSSKNAINNELVIESLSSIDERLKVQSIVLVSQLEQQNITNQLLSRLAVSGIGGSGNGNNNGGNLVQDAKDAEDIFKGAKNFLKNAGKVLGGLVMENPITAGVVAAGAVGVGAAEWIRRTDHNEDTSPNAPTKTGDALQSEIATLRADIERQKQHLALNPTDKSTIEVLKKLEAKLDKDLGNANVNDTKDAATPKYGPWHYGGTPSGPIIQNPGDVLTSVRPMSSGMPPLHNGSAYAPSAVPSGQSPWSIIEHGGSGNRDKDGNLLPAMPAGGGSGTTRGAARASGQGTSQQKQNASQVYDAFLKAGYSPEWAKIMTGEVGRENSMQDQFLYGTHTDAANHATNMGMFSWQGDRSAELQKFMQEKGLLDESGKIKKGQASLDAMAEFSKHEIDTNPRYKKTRDAMAANSNPDYNEGADTVGRNYVGWRIDDPQYRQSGLERRAKFAGMVGPNSGQSGPDETFTPPKDTTEVLQHIQKARDMGLVNGDQCVALAAGAVGVRLDSQHGAGSNVHGWRRGEPVMGSNLKAGTAVATFFDRNGKPSQRYADGSATGGDMGADLDHAGNIVSYDKDGHGFMLADQWGGKHPSGTGHVTHVTDDGKDREHRTSSYAAVKTEDGQYLGGKNSPMYLHDETGMPHRPASLGSLKGIVNNASMPHHPDSASAIMRGRRPEEGRNTAADALDMQQYKKDFDAYSESQRENNRGNAFHHTDTSKTVASQLVMTSHENALKESLRVRHNPVVQQFNSEHGGTPDLSVNTKSGRLSDKDVGSANPPAHRLKELFVSSENTKGF